MAGFPKGAQRRADKAKHPVPGVPHDLTVIAEQIVKYRGNISKVADSVGTDRGTIYDMLKRHPHLQQLVDQGRQRWIDDIEDTVFDRAASSNDTQLQTFVLKTQGRARGWEPMQPVDTSKDAVNALAQYIASTNTRNPAEQP